MPINPGRILYEDEYLLAVLKLSGELVVAGKGRMDRLPLLDFLKKQYPGLKPIHRLDFETSGVVVFARNRNVLAAALEKKFAGWTKTYRTLVAGKIQQDSGVIDFPLLARSGEGTVEARTSYKVLKRFDMCTYVEAEIQRGQFHQIRRHFATIKHPLVLDDEHGDKKFNKTFSKKFKFHRFFLHAIVVDFPHPVTGEQMHIEAPLPPVFEEILGKLGKH